MNFVYFVYQICRDRSFMGVSLSDCKSKELQNRPSVKITDACSTNRTAQLTSRHLLVAIAHLA